MHHLLKAFLAATLGTACCSTPRPVTPASARGRTTGVRDHTHAGPHGAHGVGTQHAFSNADAWTRVFDEPTRDSWQHPSEVLRALDLAPTMSVADVGAGTGYFAVRLAQAVPAGLVIATDVEPDMVRFLRERAHRENRPNLRATLATRTASGLAAQSVDRILIVHVWHHLTDRIDYAHDLAAALRPGGKLFIVDFDLAARRGPPADMRIAPERLIAELETAGFVAKVSSVVIPDQYIVEAQKRP